MFATGSFFLLSFYIFLVEKTISFASIKKAIFIGGSGAFLSAIIGFYMGKIIDQPPEKKDSYSGSLLGNDDLNITDLMQDELKQISKIEEDKNA